MVLSDMVRGCVRGCLGSVVVFFLFHVLTYPEGGLAASDK